MKDGLIRMQRSLGGRSSREGGEQQQAASKADHLGRCGYSNGCVGVLSPTYAVYEESVGNINSGAERRVQLR